jgi:hypothetical protein
MVPRKFRRDRSWGLRVFAVDGRALSSTSPLLPATEGEDTLTRRYGERRQVSLAVKYSLRNLPMLPSAQSQFARDL